MATPSKKHEKFVSEPMGEKPVTDLPGIGEVLGNLLNEKGYYKASQVYGKLLELNKEPARFKNWFKETCGANAEQQEDCYSCLREYCNQFL